MRTLNGPVEFQPCSAAYKLRNYGQLFISLGSIVFSPAEAVLIAKSLRQNTANAVFLKYHLTVDEL